MPLTESGPLHAVVQRSANTRLTTADRLSTSGLDYMTWASKMVDEGKMYWANSASNTTNVEVRAAKATFNLKNIACGFIGAKYVQYEDGRQAFCNLISHAAGYTLTEGSYILQDGICEGNEDCTFIIEVSFRVAGGFVGDALPSICTPVFDELWNSCNGNVGGTAEVSVTDSGGTQTGTILAEFFTHDSDAKSPANTDTSVCGYSTFN